MSSQPVKKLSCKRCQYRKLKCSRTEPCQNCMTAKQACEYRQVDRKKLPATQKYVASLENRVAWLESFIMNLKSESDLEREAMLRSVSFGDHFEANDVPALSQAARSEIEPSKHKGDSTAHLQVDLEGSLIYHGATSIYRSDMVNPTTSAVLDDLSPRPLSYSTSDAKFEHVAEHFGINLQDELVENALMQFFKWQYPHFMFIYREAFLRDHFSERANCKYWSSALLLSICALGTFMSPEQRHRQASEKFFSAAESILIVSGFIKPSVITVQGFLCLAFYEIGRGNLSKGWGFSGIAFRMAQDLGMQRDPKQWKSHDVTLVTEEDMEIRRRIFWGCYTSDKLISIILGRPVHLFQDNAEVQTAERLPDFPEMKPWLPAGFDDCSSGLGDVNPLIPCFKAQIGLSKIIENMLSKLFSAKASLRGLGRQTCLNNISLALCKWYEELPNCVKWNRWEPTSNILIPSVAALHLLFQSVRIALNYDQATSNQSSEETESARKCYISSAEDITHILRKYRSQYGLNHSPLITVYGVMQACRAHTYFGTQDEAQYLLRSLDECCAAWYLAHQTRLRLTRDGIQ